MFHWVANPERCKPRPGFIVLRTSPLLITAMLALILIPSLARAQQATLPDDAQTSANKPNKNFGDSDSVQVTGAIEKGFLKFKLTPNLPNGTIGSFVGKATLKLFVADVKSPGTVEIHPVLGAWSESTITDSSAPALGPLVATVNITSDLAGKWITVDMTQSVKDWLDGVMVNQGVALVSNAGGAEVVFDSKENTRTSHEPRLEIVLNHATTADQATTATTISGVLPTNKGGTGLSAPGASGNVLRSNGTIWTSAPLVASDFPGLANSFVQNQDASAQSANFNITGNGTANIFNAGTQFNIGGSRVFSVSGGNVSANGVGAVPNSNTFGGGEAGASVIPSATTAAGNFNTLFGVKAGMNTAKTAPAANAFDGCCNSFFGNLVGLKNTTGHSNAFFGGAAGIGNTTGSFNSFFGDGAGSDFYDPNVARTGSLNTFIGNLSGGGVTTGSNNTFLGANTRGTSNLTNATAIGADTMVAQSNSVVIGNNANVGIGTSAPTSKLTVAGLIETTTGGIKFPDGSVQTSAASGGGSLPPGSPNYVQSNPPTQQSGVSFNIGGNGTAAGTLSGNAINAATQFNLGGQRILSASLSLANTSLGLNSGTVNSGGNSSFFGYRSGQSNAGQFNSFFGALTGVNTTGDHNSFFGMNAGTNNTIGFFNSFFGTNAGLNNFSGGENVFLGRLGGYSNTIGSNNTVIGSLANVGANNLNFATAIGSNAIVNTSDTIVLGKPAGTYFTGLGSPGVARPADTVQIPGDLNVAGALTLNIVNATTQYNLGGNRILSTAGFQNTFVGLNTGASNVAGCCNAFFGFHAGQLNNANDNSFFGNNAGQANTIGARNSFFGSAAGYLNTSGNSNSFFGVSAGQNNSTGSDNSFLGDSAGISNTEGGTNSFFGARAGRTNTTGGLNAFFGAGAGYYNNGSHNSFFGMSAGFSNTTGNFNTFVGRGAGLSNTLGSTNDFFGAGAGESNTEGHDNAFFGASSGSNNVTGSDNAFFGREAGRNNSASGNSFFGRSAGKATTSGSVNSFFGYGAGYLNTTGSVNAFFGNSAGFSNTTQLYNTFIGGNAGSNNGNGDATNNASENTFIGSSAGGNNSTGGLNSFVGAVSGGSNTTGSSNAFFGRYAGLTNTVGSSNTALGVSADFGANNLTNASAVGANAQVTQSNSLVLGSINGINGATADTKVGIGTTAPTSRLTVAGLIETNTGVGGIKFPDGTIQTTAATVTSVTTDGTTLTGNGTVASPLAIKGLGVSTAQLADSSVTAPKIASGQVVKTLNSLTDNVTLAAGSNVTITPSGNTLTISATGGGSGGGSFIQNQTTQQTAANFNIDGTGTANSFDAQAQYNIGGNRVLIGRVGPYNNLFAGVGAGGQITDGGNNSFFGINAGSNTTSTFNSFFGFNAGHSNTFAGFNSFFGANAGTGNTSGVANSFFGTYAGNSNLTGTNNSFFGYHAGFLNTTGSTNSFFGNAAGNANTTGHENTIVGAFAGSANTTGFNNSFFGYQAGLSTTGNNNSFVGFNAGTNNTTGSSNTAIGYNANVLGGGFDHATAIGADSLVSSNDTIALGRTSGADTVMVYGKMRVNTLGTAGPFALCLNSNSEISSCSSSLRYKTNIAPFRSGLNVVNQLRPITFQWKADGKQDLGFGAEDVAQVNPLFVTYNKDGQVEGVKYDRLTTVLVNAVKEQQEQISEQNKRVETQAEQIEKQRKQIEEQRESLQKQQAQIEALKRLICPQNPTADVCKVGRK